MTGKILRINSQIYDFVEHSSWCTDHFKKERDDFAAYCVAKDTIQDTAEALMQISETGLSNNMYARYIELYGLLQAIILQQDSITELLRIFLKKKPDISDDSAWNEIRNLRNLCVGHPMEQTDFKALKRHEKLCKELGDLPSKSYVKRCMLSRLTLTFDKFSIVYWDKDRAKDEFEEIELKSLLVRYFEEAANHLKATLTFLNSTGISNNQSS